MFVTGTTIWLVMVVTRELVSTVTTSFVPVVMESESRLTVAWELTVVTDWMEPERTV